MLGKYRIACNLYWEMRYRLFIQNINPGLASFTCHKLIIQRLKKRQKPQWCRRLQNCSKQSFIKKIRPWLCPLKIAGFYHLTPYPDRTNLNVKELFTLMIVIIRMRIINTVEHGFSEFPRTRLWSPLSIFRHIHCIKIPENFVEGIFTSLYLILHYIIHNSRVSL